MESRHGISEIDVIDVKLPSGSEVGAAVYHPVVPQASGTGPVRTPAWKSRLREVGSQGAARAQQLKHVAVQRTNAAKSSVVQSIGRMSANVRATTHENVNRMNGSMRSEPMKWAGIAAGAGVVLGLLGRLMDHRRHHARHRTPHVLIVDANC